MRGNSQLMTAGHRVPGTLIIGSRQIGNLIEGTRRTITPSPPAQCKRPPPSKPSPTQHPSLLAKVAIIELEITLCSNTRLWR